MVNGAEGIWHMGQRDIVWTRVSKTAFERGVRLRHYGEIIHAKFLENFPSIVDKVRVTLITDAQEAERRVAVARGVYKERNRRVEAMTDESVDTFYSCLLCQSFAPNHVCIITPERLGLCGAYNWLDGKAAFEIDETGPNQPVRKGECLDPIKGIFTGVNEYVHSASHKTIDAFCAYSIMDRPMTSCGCFEVICAYVPEANGVMAVNREYSGDTPVGMGFSTLAGNVGGGQQTPGFIGCGKAFLTSKKFLQAEGGHARLVWMTKELKQLLGDDLKKRFAEQGQPGLMDMIADETIAVEAKELRAYMEKVSHPALSMGEMDAYAQQAGGTTEEPAAIKEVKETPALTAPAAVKAAASMPAQDIEAIKKAVIEELRGEIRRTLAAEIADEIVGSLSERLLGGKGIDLTARKESPPKKSGAMEVKKPAVTASERISAIKSFAVVKVKNELSVRRVKLGATRKEGGTRGSILEVGGASVMPFHHFEGDAGRRPLVAMEVFDRPGEKYPPVLRALWGDLLEKPALMAQACVERHGADLISVRLDGTHPQRGARSASEAVRTVKELLSAVSVPLIVTGHNHYESMNEVMKEIARECAGENLLLNWVEQDNYRTIAGAALAYGHTLVAQSPIDVNIAKQLNILLTNMSVKPESIVIDPMTGALGYGLEYCYSVMERIRLTALGGDVMLACPMIVSPGQECAKIKELRASEEDFPEWGDLARRAAIWELSTATSMLYAGADILIMYHPEAAEALKKTIYSLMDGRT